MAVFVANVVVKAMVRRQLRVECANVLVMGFAFKKNCPDTRNIMVADLVIELQGFVGQVDVHDPEVDPAEARHEPGIVVGSHMPKRRYDAVVLVAKHNAIMELDGVFSDLKGVLPLGRSDGGL